MSKKRLKSRISRIWNPKRPFDELPRIKALDGLETAAVLKACIAARAAVAELKQAAELLPNQGTLVNTLPVLEARASSEIENIVTTGDRLFRFRQASEQADPATKEALRYSQALFDGMEAVRKRSLNTNTAERVCSLIMGKTMRVRTVPGTAIARGSGAVVYTPPQGERLLRDLLADWERFLHERTDLDPLVRMAAAHYQFEAIHPFMDGNGRTGRILNVLFLIEEGLLTLPILYLSRSIMRRKAEYYRLLLAVTREGAWEEWLLYMLRGVEETATWTLGKIAAIRTAFEETAKKIREERPKIYSRELVDVVFEQPYCRIGNVVEAGLARRETASRHLKELVKIGVLREQKAGRERLFVNVKLMELLVGEEDKAED